MWFTIPSNIAMIFEKFDQTYVDYFKMIGKTRLMIGFYVRRSKYIKEIAMGITFSLERDGMEFDARCEMT